MERITQVANEAEQIAHLEEMLTQQKLLREGAERLYGIAADGCVWHRARAAKWRALAIVQMGALCALAALLVYALLAGALPR
jgi:hypothetical protein